MAKILISYRRADSDVFAGRVHDRIVIRYGDESVFIDVDDIPFGKDFRIHIQEELEKADAVLVIIGPRWLGSGKGGRTRIMDSHDPVRIEVETALSKGLPTIPILMGDVAMPRPDQLPETLKDFPFLNAAPVDTGRDFHRDLSRVIARIDQILRLPSDVSDGGEQSSAGHHTADVQAHRGSGETRQAEPDRLAAEERRAAEIEFQAKEADARQREEAAAKSKREAEEARVAEAERKRVEAEQARQAERDRLAAAAAAARRNEEERRQKAEAEERQREAERQEADAEALRTGQRATALRGQVGSHGFSWLKKPLIIVPLSVALLFVLGLVTSAWEMTIGTFAPAYGLAFGLVFGFILWGYAGAPVGQAAIAGLVVLAVQFASSLEISFLLQEVRGLDAASRGMAFSVNAIATGIIFSVVFMAIAAKYEPALRKLTYWAIFIGIWLALTLSPSLLIGPILGAGLTADTIKIYYFAATMFKLLVMFSCLAMWLRKARQRREAHAELGT
jgi:hypothetical protein